MDGNYLLYDGECPFCSRYVARARVVAAAGPLALLDARLHPDLVRRHTAEGLDINEGMILRLDGRTYFGGDVLNRLALLSTRSGAFNKANAALFRHPRLSRLLYPLLRGGRNAALKMLRRGQIVH